MAESTLTAAYNDLQADVGFFLGYGRGPAFGDPAYVAAQQATIDRVLKGGLRRVYFSGQDWSFLRPTTTLVLAANSATIPCPDDWNGLEGQVTLSTAGSQIFYPVNEVGIGMIYAKFAEFPTMTSRPLLIAEEPLKGTGVDRGQRFQLHVFPTADQAYTLTVQYHIAPDYLTGALPYLYGGPGLSQLFLAACLAEADLLLDDEVGIHEQNFKERLQNAVDNDRRHKPQKLGYNADHSDEILWPGAPWQHTQSGILVQGVQY